MPAPQEVLNPQYLPPRRSSMPAPQEVLNHQCLPPRRSSILTRSARGEQELPRDHTASPARFSSFCALRAAISSKHSTPARLFRQVGVGAGDPAVATRHSAGCHRTMERRYAWLRLQRLGLGLGLGLQRYRCSTVTCSPRYRCFGSA